MLKRLESGGQRWPGLGTDPLLSTNVTHGITWQMLVVLVLLSQNVSLGNPACRKVSPGGLARLQRKNLNLTEALQQSHSLLETDQEHTAISVNSKIMLNAIQYKRQESRRILWQDYITLLAKNATVRRGARNWEETAQKLASL